MSIKCCCIPLLLLLAACAAEVPGTGPLEARVSLSFHAESLTKSSVYDPAEMTALKEVVLYGVLRDGSWKRAYLRARNGEIPDTTLSFVTGFPVRFYALGNMGDVTVPVDSEGKLLLEEYTYLLPLDTDLTARGFPMAGSVTLVPEGDVSLSVPMRALVARLQLDIDKRGLSAEAVLRSGCLRICQANRRLCPFAESQALTEEDLFPDSFDYQLFTAEREASIHSGIVLYVPENLQGVLLHGDNQAGKIPSELSGGKDRLCTYLEYEGEKLGADDGVAGTVLYRSYLGGNETNDFSVERAVTYVVTLSLSWEGLLWNADGWRIDDTQVEDRRRLVLSTEPHSQHAVNGSLGMVSRGSGQNLYVNFSRDAGNSWVSGEKDSLEWPYGWTLLVDGVAQEGLSGVTPGGVVWRYSAAEDGLLVIGPSADAEVGVVHTVQLQSADGSLASAEVDFTVSLPLFLHWSGDGVPVYVAQRGLLLLEGLDDPEDEVEISVLSGSDCVRLQRAEEGILVSYLAPGTAVIHVECGVSSQSGDFTVRPLAPRLTLATLQYACSPDGSPARSGGQLPYPVYRDAEDRVLSRQVATAGEIVTDLFLASDLYDETLALEATVTAGSLLDVNCAGTGPIDIYVMSLQDYPLSDGAPLGTVSIGACEAASGVTPLSVSLVSQNPFGDFPQTVSLSEAGDMADVSPLGIGPATALGLTGVSRSLTAPLMTADSAWQGVEAYLDGDAAPDGVLSAHFTHNPASGAVQYNSLLSGRNRSNAGCYTLYGYVENRYSHERVHMPFFRGQLFLHGALTGKAVVLSGNKMGVFVDYCGSEDFYASGGLGAVFPDVGTRRVNATYPITWYDYENGMTGHQGSCSVEVNPASRPVTLPGNWLFSVTDDCRDAHPGLDVEECHANYFAGPGDDGGPGMHFLPPDSSPKYADITLLNDQTAALLPGGYYLLHLIQQIEGRWL